MAETAKKTDTDTLQLKVSRVFEENWEAFHEPVEDVKIIVNEGGTRSTKTWSICQMFIVNFLKVTGEILTIARKTSPSLRTSVMRDFFQILRMNNLYTEANHNKTEREYTFHNNLIEFTSMDMPQKKRGTKRDHLWLNETNEYDWEDFFQMMIRTSGKIILDYNPSDETHWIYDKVLPRKDCRIIRSTYLDNPFLEESIIREIENLKEHDENYWNIYGLGKRGKRKAIIFDNWDLVDEFPDNVDEVFYGEDFGYNNPSALVKIGIKDKVDIFVEELIYESNLTNQQLIERMKQVIPNRKKKITADCAEPDRIEEILMAGFNIEGCKKGKNSVKDGIDKLKRKRIHITKSSVNLQKEIRTYKWKEDKAGKILDEPVPFNDHAVSALRYAVDDFDIDSDLAGKIMGRQVNEANIEIVRVGSSSSRARRERQQARQRVKSIV